MIKAHIFFSILVFGAGIMTGTGFWLSLFFTVGFNIAMIQNNAREIEKNKQKESSNKEIPCLC